MKIKKEEIGYFWYRYKLLGIISIISAVFLLFLTAFELLGRAAGQSNTHLGNMPLGLVITILIFSIIVFAWVLLGAKFQKGNLMVVLAEADKKYWLILTSHPQIAYGLNQMIDYAKESKDTDFLEDFLEQTEEMIETHKDLEIFEMQLNILKEIEKTNQLLSNKINKPAIGPVCS